LDAALTLDERVIDRGCEMWGGCDGSVDQQERSTREATPAERTPFRQISLYPLLSFMLAMPLHAAVIQEAGSLRGFIAGDCPTAAYDNWLSHVSEGIAVLNYNDYGPDWLDRQNNGFGSYRLIPDTPAGDQTLHQWRRIFDSFLLDHPINVDFMLTDSAEFRYEVVQFYDTDRDREVMLLREMLDSSFVDSNHSWYGPYTIDGGFRNGWGLFVFDSSAPRPWLMLQVVHPCDDFIGVQAAIDLFFRLGAGALAIHGAGREVLYTPGPGFSNSRSLSDPSRYGRAPIQVFQEAYVDHFASGYPHSAMVIQMHSYDRSNNLVYPVIISEGADWPYPFLPFRDMSGGQKTIIHLTSNPPIPEGQYQNGTTPLPALHVAPYYGINVVGGYSIIMPDGGEYTIGRPISHRGDPNNVQGIHLHSVPSCNPNQAVAPFIHVELDEWPHYLDTGGLEPEDLVDYPTGAPTWETFVPWLEFYIPFFEGLENWFAWFDTAQDEIVPLPVEVAQVSQGNDGRLTITLEQGDTDFRRAWVEVVADLEDLDDDSPVILSGLELAALKSVGEINSFTFASPFEAEALQLAVRSRNIGGATSALSEVHTVSTHDLTVEQPSHQPFSHFPLGAWPAWISAQFEDGGDVASVEVIFRIGEGEPDTMRLELMASRLVNYAAPLPFVAGQISTGDFIHYRILTIDDSEAGTIAYLPNPTDWYTFTLIEGNGPLRSWDFEENADGIDLFGDWAWGVPTTSPPGGAFEGQHVLATNLDGPYTVGPTGNRAVIGDILRPEYGPLVLSWWQWVQYPERASYPGVAMHGGGLFRLGGAAPAGPLQIPLYTHRIISSAPTFGSFPAFSGSSEGWEYVVVDLMPEYGAGDAIAFQNYATSDVPAELGWYVDNLEVSRSVNHHLPTSPRLLEPEEMAELNEPIQRFRWSRSRDDDPRIEPVYRFRLWSDSDEVLEDALIDTLIDVNVAELAWEGPEPRVLNWEVTAVSQGDEVENVGGPRSLILPAMNVAEDAGLPIRFALRPGFPNPFNSTVAIRYDLPRATEVRLEVFNLLGQRVALLESGRVAAGYRHAVFDARNQASGLYFVRLEAGEFRAVQKILLLK